MFKTVVYATGGMVATEFAMNFVPISLGGQWGAVGIKAAVAWLLGKLGHKFFMSPQDARDFTLGGYISAAQDAFAILRGYIPAVTQAKIAPAAAAAAQQQAAVGAAATQQLGMGDLSYNPWAAGGFGDLAYNAYFQS